MKHKKKYFSILVALAVLSSVLTYSAVIPLTKLEHLQKPLTGLCVLFGIITFSNSFVLFRYVEKRPQVFIRAFMGSFTVKFFINLVVLAGYLYHFKIGRIPIVVLFFFLFVIYTVVEKINLFKAFNSVKTD